MRPSDKPEQSGFGWFPTPEPPAPAVLSKRFPRVVPPSGSHKRWEPLVPLKGEPGVVSRSPRNHLTADSRDALAAGFRRYLEESSGGMWAKLDARDKPT
jgi:hypothetical protein